MRKYSVVIFDLDGTLLNTLEDLRISINYALKENEIDRNYSLDEIKYFTGNGVDMLISRAIENSNNIELHQKVKVSFRTHYMNSQYKNTIPYPGIIEVLKNLKRDNLFLGVLSNKPNSETIEIINKMFGDDLFDFVQGGIVGEPLKPNPKVINRLIEKNKFKKTDVLYIGDTDVDLEFSNNAGIDCAIVTWGFRKPEEVGKPKYFIDTAAQILDIITKI